MASVSINITDNGDGTFTLTNVFRSPTTLASGGTDLVAGNSTSSPFTQFQDAITAPADTMSNPLGVKCRTPQEALAKASTVIALDRSWNG